jgi:hypothetical protein
MIKSNIFYCRQCITASTRPAISFNANGICSACVNSKIKNWKSTLSNTLPYISETKTSDDFYKISM